MIEKFEFIISTLLQPGDGDDIVSIFDPSSQFDEHSFSDIGIAQTLNAAFMITLVGSSHPLYENAKSFLNQKADTTEWGTIAKFYLEGAELIPQEIETVYRRETPFADQLDALAEWFSKKEYLDQPDEALEMIWSLFFPEAAGIRTNRAERIRALRCKRAITVLELNPTPLSDPARQVLFTSNVLLTLPAENSNLDELHLDEHMKDVILQATREAQRYWYDHPIQIGVEPQKNEILYGLHGLESAFEFERMRGNVADCQKLTCILSVSVTHEGLQAVARRYLETEFARSGGLKDMDVFIFTEVDTKKIIADVLAPAAEHYLHRRDLKNSLNVFGVDGNYARHYCFLKAIAAFWQVFIREEVQATFKIDLDQVFPQKELVEQTGESVFEHFKTPLWGAAGVDSKGHSVELGMIAGALVNERDIGRSLFMPDVPFPDSEWAFSPDEHIFFSRLPQALSTEAEMMTRYNTPDIDGIGSCIQRVHVTGGTNGILISSLRRHRPFTPSFVGRAEDQVYLLSVLSQRGTKLAYVHKDGLIMRHDKEVFAGEAIRAAYIGRMIGDYVRLLYFSAYARAITAGDISRVKNTVDPFTGCFISRIPVAVAYLRFTLKAASLFAAAQGKDGLEFIRIGAQRIASALEFIQGEESQLEKRYGQERAGWNLYFDTLSALEEALKCEDSFALRLRDKAKEIVDGCAVNPD